MKKMFVLLSCLLFLGNITVLAQNWVVGGNNLTSNARFGSNNNYSVAFETNNSERGRITKDGLWGFNNNSPAARVHINGSTSQDAFRVDVGGVMKMRLHSGGGLAIGSTIIPVTNGLYVAGSTGIGATPGIYKMKITHGIYGIDIENSSTLDDWEIFSNNLGLSLYSNDKFRGTFDITTGAYASVSDERLKTNVQAMPSVLEKISKLKPDTYQFKDNPNARESAPAYGFLAQEVMEVFPHLITHLENEERGEDVYAMDYSGFGVIAIKAIQELQQHISTLQSRITELETELKITDKKFNPNSGTTGVWLETNFPNPFSQTTSIGYLAPAQAKQVDLLITNLQGVPVRRFNYLEPGKGQIELTAGSIPDGTYIYSLIVDGKAVASQKMILTR